MDPDNGSINLSSLEFNVSNEAGTIFMGPVIRTVVSGEEQAITNDGQPIANNNGGNGLTEFKIKINEFADGTLFDSEVGNPAIAEVTLGTVVDDDGLKVLNQQGNEIVCNIELSSGAKVQIDKAGNVNINEGKSTKPTDPPAIAVPLQETVQSVETTSDGETVIDYVYAPLQSQQRAAREGDRVTIPLTVQAPPDTDHPGQIAKSLVNLSTMTQLASSFMSPVGPCTFIPVPGLKLVGEITQGANGVYIGSLDKTAEATENTQNT